MRLKLPLFILSLGVIAACSFFAACSSPTETTISIGASMTGKVQLYNADLEQFVKDASGVSVSLLGTKFHATTDTSSSWTLSGMAPGIYSVVYTKPNYDTLVRGGTTFSGAGVTFVPSATLHFLTNSALT